MSLSLFLVLAVGAGAAALLAVRRATGGRRWAAIASVAIGAVPVLMVLGFGSAYVVNNWRLARFSAQLFEYPLPPGAREIARRSEVGLLSGDGDHCDFVATQQLATTLPLAAVRAHYAGLRLRPAIGSDDGGGGGLLALQVEPRAGGVVVTAWDPLYGDIWDVRCT